MLLDINFTTHSSFYILIAYLILQHIMDKMNHDKYVSLLFYNSNAYEMSMIIHQTSKHK
jgi:hypothetical protein